MRCDELKERVWAGQPVGEDGRAHLSACAACREEFGFLGALRSAVPAPPAALRERVLAAMPAPRASFRWQVPAIAAAVAAALGLGIFVGRAVEARNVSAESARVVLREVVREKKGDDRDFAVLAIALEAVYRGQVDCEFEGVTCRKIHAGKAVREMVPYCPVAQKLEVMAKERPDQVQFDQ